MGMMPVPAYSEGRRSRTAVLVLREQDPVGHAGGVEHDPLGVLGQQVNEDILVGRAAGQGVVTHGHLPVGEVVGQAAAGDPERLAAGGLGDLGPILVPVEEGGSPEHHGGGSQGCRSLSVPV